MLYYLSPISAGGQILYVGLSLSAWDCGSVPQIGPIYFNLNPKCSNSGRMCLAVQFSLVYCCSVLQFACLSVFVYELVVCCLALFPLLHHYVLEIERSRTQNVKIVFSR